MYDCLSNHARSLTGDVKRRYLDKIAVLEPRDPYFLMKDSKQFKAYKSLDAYNFFVSGWVFNAKWLALNDYILAVAEVTLNDPQEFKNFLSNLEKVNSNAAILRVVEPFNLKFVYNEFPKSLANLYKDEYSILNLEELVCKTKCSSIEISTKMQAKTQNWFLYRTGCIIASRIKDVCSVKSSYSNKSLLKSVCYPLKNTFKSLVINPSLPYLGASPDGIINCDCCGKGCLEIKSMSYLFNGHLSKNHQYYYQLQTQILLCGTQYERINIDPDILEEILNKSKLFFYESILPELLERHFSNTEIKPIETYDEILTYKNCVCKKNTGGKMIMRTKEGCPNLWYHYNCLGIKRKPSTKTWKCALCQ
ncbi:hypothetical protein QTP88_016173 [Uroleucon formosanum]